MGWESSYSMIRSMDYSPATSRFATSLARSPPYNIAGAADDIFDPCVSLHFLFYASCAVNVPPAQFAEESELKKKGKKRDDGESQSDQVKLDRKGGAERQISGEECAPSSEIKL